MAPSNRERSETVLPGDAAWMEMALDCARRGEGRTRPNPPVGAVLVKAGRLLGCGYHRRAGTAHAEVAALKAAGGTVAGATLYVTLEPCSTQGRTGPCTEAILAAGIRRVVVGTRDPNPRHGGRGLRILRRAGVSVVEGVGEKDARLLIAPFARYITSGRPYLTIKLGMTLDGRIADARNASRWITGPAARRQVQAMRQRADAIMVGSRTARLDDPSLLCRGERPGRLFRVIVDAAGELPLSAAVLNDGFAETTVVATTALCPASRQDAYARRGATVWVLPARRGRVALAGLMDMLGGLGLLHVVCEGGGELAAALVRAELVDELVLFVAPLLLGGGGVSAIGGPGWRLSGAPRFAIESVLRVGDDVMLRAVVAPRAEGASTAGGSAAKRKGAAAPGRCACSRG